MDAHVRISLLEGLAAAQAMWRLGDHELSVIAIKSGFWSVSPCM
jgi:hypothetical protein